MAEFGSYGGAHHPSERAPDGTNEAADEAPRDGVRPPDACLFFPAVRRSLTSVLGSDLPRRLRGLTPVAGDVCRV